MFRVLIVLGDEAIRGAIELVFRQDPAPNFQGAVFPNIHVTRDSEEAYRLFEKWRHDIVISWVDSDADTLRGDFLIQLRQEYSWQIGRQILVCVGEDFTDNQVVRHWLAWRNSVTMHNRMIYVDVGRDGWQQKFISEIKTTLCSVLFNRLEDSRAGEFKHRFANLFVCAGWWWNELERDFKIQLRQAFCVDETVIEGQPPARFSLMSLQDLPPVDPD